ncbi:MAG: transposase [Bacteroidetes bacterium]|nr:transposase [Bacteroidota bacterium]
MFLGTAPFLNESGSSIKKRTKISHLADKQMKALLDQGAKSAPLYDKELKKLL